VNRRNAVADPAANESAAPASQALGAPCRHLRSNGMYIFDGRPDGSDDDDHEPSACWCLLTMKAFGPDDDLVSRRECRDPGRPCYEPL
jgi:hypothetical protein